MSIFNFYNEIANDYEMLVPDKRVGLVIFNLYQKQKNGDISASHFSEEEIIKSIKEVRKDLKTEQKEQFNQAIKALQKYFLWRDEDKRVYRFRPYALKWCNAIEELLIETFNPTEIQKGFKHLINTLSEAQFESWYNLTFNSYAYKISSQISALDRQVANAVIDFRAKVSNDATYDIVKLKNIVDTLDDIKNKTDELNSAFSGSHEINRLLTDYMAKPENFAYSDRILQVINFFKDIRENLKIISRKIDGVKPKLNEYVRDINRMDFYKHFKLFLKFILEKSKTDKNRIHLPDAIPNQILGFKEQSKFIIIRETIDKREFNSSRSTKINLPGEDKEETARQLKKANDYFELQKKIKYYIVEIEKRLKLNNELDFSAYFYEVLEKENGNYNILVKLAFQTIKKYHQSKDYDILISNEKVKVVLFPKISIWKTIIYKKF
jgi:hypothetical protein